MGRITELIFWVEVKTRDLQKISQKFTVKWRLRPITRIIVTYWSACRVFVLPIHMRAKMYIFVQTLRITFILITIVNYSTFR